MNRSFGIGFVELLLVAAVVESVLWRWVRPVPGSKGRIFMRSAIRGVAYSPVMVGIGHDGLILPFPAALLYWPKADGLWFGYGLPALAITIMIYLISRGLGELNKKPGESLV